MTARQPRDGDPARVVGPGARGVTGPTLVLSAMFLPFGFGVLAREVVRWSGRPDGPNTRALIVLGAFLGYPFLALLTRAAARRTGVDQESGLRRPAVRHVLEALAASGALILAESLYTRLLGAPEPSPDSLAAFLGDPSALPWTTQAALIFSLAIMAPVIEEYLFRGTLLALSMRRWGRYGGIAATTLLFAAIHGTDPTQVPPMALLGLLAAFVRVRSGSLWCAVIVHIVNNGVALLVLWRSSAT